MVNKQKAPAKCFPTLTTLLRPFSSMTFMVLNETEALVEGILGSPVLRGLYFGMTVLRKVRAVMESLSAFVALPRLFSSVNSGAENGAFTEGFPTPLHS